MTARSGDALSHVNFQATQNAVLTEISAPEFCPLARAAIPRFACGASVPVIFAWRP
jgi:hypothetical protein